MFPSYLTLIKLTLKSLMWNCCLFECRSLYSMFTQASLWRETPTTTILQCERQHTQCLWCIFSFSLLLKHLPFSVLVLLFPFFSRSSSYQFTDPSLYSQATPSVTYYETSPTTGSQVTSPASTQPVSVTSGMGTGVVSMFSEGSSGITVVAGGSSSGVGGSGGVVTSGGVGSYVIQGGYMLGGAGGGNQNFSHNTRASPATVSVFVFLNDDSEFHPVLLLLTKINFSHLNKIKWNKMKYLKKNLNFLEI